MTTLAIPQSGEIFCTNAVIASSPPAEAPMATTGKDPEAGAESWSGMDMCSFQAHPRRNVDAQKPHFLPACLLLLCSPKHEACQVAKILVVENDRLYHLVLVEALREAGYEVLGAVDGGDARKSLSTEMDLALLDGQLPDMSGLTLLEEFKAAHPACPVIVVKRIRSRRTRQGQ